MLKLRSVSGGFSRVLVPLLGASLAVVAGVHCGGGSNGNDNPPAGDDAGDGGVDVVTPTPDATPDTAVDAGPVTCTKPPTFSTAIRVNHNPDALRNVATASVTGLPDGTALVVFAEAIDTSGRYAIYARTVDPTTNMAADDERLDVDADQVGNASGLRLTTLENGAVVAQWRGATSDSKRLRVFQHGKWSPELLGPTGAMPSTDADALSFGSAPDGTVMVARMRSTSAPFSAASVFHPDEGGPRGSWTAPQVLDLDGGTGMPTVLAYGRPDGSYLTLVWHGTGGPSVRTRSPSGGWTMPSARADIGARDAQPDERVLDDGSIVLVALEGSGDTRRVVWSTWTAAAGWTAARLVSKLGAANGVVPFKGTGADPFLFTISGSKVEFVGWVAACATSASMCEFHAVQSTYANGAWTDPPVDLQVGPTTNGADYAQVVALDPAHPLILRGRTDSSALDFAMRAGDTWSAATNLLSGPAGDFDNGTLTTPRFFGNGYGTFAIAGRTNGMGNPLQTLMGKITPSAMPPGTWSPVVASSAEMHGANPVSAFVDGAGGFSVAVNDAVEGTSQVPLLAHDFGNGGALDVTAVMSADESNAYFSNVPNVPPRAGGLDRSAIYLVSALPTGSTNSNRRLRAYAYNGQGTTAVPKLLANEARAPRSFSQSVLMNGCGGAIVYAVDPSDGSHALEMVFVQ